MNRQTVSIIGLGRLGVPMAACFASRMHRVIGVDIEQKVVDLMNKGVAPVYEPALDQVLEENVDRITATSDVDAAISASQITFIVVPTPSDERGRFSLEHVLPAVERIGQSLRRKSAFHLVVLTSTVLPGSTEAEIRPVLEDRSGKQCGRDFGLCYSPEFVALGSVIHDLLNPEFVLIGEATKRAGDLLQGFYHTICGDETPVARMNIVNAELTKLAVNTYVTTKISFANMLTEICELLPGADVNTVTSALGLDGRIGDRYLRGAIGYGGPCFPRDNVAFAELARQLGANGTLAEATDRINRHQLRRLEDHVLARLPKGGRVGILGLSYKPDTNVVEESQGVGLARSMMSQKIPTVLFDPAAMENAREKLGPQAVLASSMEDCVRQADVLVISTPWSEFKDIQPAHLVRQGRRPVVIDCWRILDSNEYHDIADYVTLGTGPADI